jgi:hypothetical protein
MDQLVTQMMKQAYTTTIVSSVTHYFRALAARRQARTQMALCRYYVANEKYPRRLSQLVPNYLDAVPKNPYSGYEVEWNITKEAVSCPSTVIRMQ